MKEAWSHMIDDTEATMVDKVKTVFDALGQADALICTLLFSHPGIKCGLTNDDKAQTNLDQLNPRLMFPGENMSHVPKVAKYRIVDDSKVMNSVSNAVKLTRGKLIKVDDLNDWRDSEYKQLDYYEEQGMFGTPEPITKSRSIFTIIWTYMVKTLDCQKKARCACD